MLVAFSVTPLGAGEEVGELVAEAVRVVRESGLPNRTDAMFTTIEGEWDEVMAVVKAATDAVAARAPRVSLVVKADLRPGVTGALDAKVESVERRLRTAWPAQRGQPEPRNGARVRAPGAPRCAGSAIRTAFDGAPAPSCPLPIDAGHSAVLGLPATRAGEACMANGTLAVRNLSVSYG